MEATSILAAGTRKRSGNGRRRRTWRVHAKRRRLCYRRPMKEQYLEEERA